MYVISDSEELLHSGWVDAFCKGLLLCDAACREEFGDALVKCQDSRSLAGFYDVEYLIDPVFSDAVADGGVADHDFYGG